MPHHAPRRHSTGHAVAQKACAASSNVLAWQVADATASSQHLHAVESSRRLVLTLADAEGPDVEAEGPGRQGGDLAWIEEEI